MTLFFWKFDPSDLPYRHHSSLDLDLYNISEDCCGYMDFSFKLAWDFFGAISAANSVFFLFFFYDWAPRLIFFFQQFLMIIPYHKKKDCNFNMELFLYVCDNAVSKHCTDALLSDCCTGMMWCWCVLLQVLFSITVWICLSQQYRTGRKATSWVIRQVMILFCFW